MLQTFPFFPLTESDNSADLMIVTITADQSSDPFLAYLPQPLWFKAAFQPAFDVHRKITRGEILLVNSSQHGTRGCVYFELTPLHRSYGHSIPVFGWLYADNYFVAQMLLTTIEMDARNAGAKGLRGPINSPKSFGGWGCLVEGSNNYPDYDPTPPLVECSETPSGIADWLINAEFSCEAEYINLYNTHLLETPDFPNVILTNPPINTLLSDSTLLNQLKQLVNDNFGNYLPDTCPPERTFALLEEMAPIPNSEDFYLLAWDKTTKQLIGYILEIPNFFQLWADEPLTMSNTNSVILAKEWRGTAFFHFLYNRLTKKMHTRGIIHREGTMIWIKNNAAVQSFSHIGFICRRYRIYQKTW